MKSGEYAFITPVPPQQTGIADYADGLIRGLRGLRNTVTVFTQSRFAPASDSRLGRVYSLKEYDTARWLPQTTVYQIGNNPTFHDEITLHFLEHGGIAHIHDFSLHHMFAYFTFLRDREIYYALITRWYGADLAKRIREHHDSGRPAFWEGSEVVSYPFNEEVVSKATAVIVHSQFARTRILQTFPEKPVYVVPQRYPQAFPIRRRRGQTLSISSMGFVDPHKRVDNVIRAIAKCRDRGVEIRFDVVGKLHPQCVVLPELSRELQIEHLVRFWGAVPPSAFADIFGRADLCIVLRDPTVGETSAIVSRALQYGLPLIVNDVGSYAELPPPTIKIALGSDSIDKLADHLCILASDNQRYTCMANAAYAYASTEATYATAIRCYDDVLRRIGLKN